MNEKNLTSITEIHLLGFQTSPNITVGLFVLVFTMFCVTIIGNLLIIVLVSQSRNLHSPMYFFLTQLSISDILLTIDIVPNMLHVILNKVGTMSLDGCLTQLFFFGVSECLECLLLMVMSYDRYLAICHPLHYTSSMSHLRCLKLIIVTWILSFSVTFIETLPTSQLVFCGPNVIDHFFCDLSPIWDLSCSDTFFIQMEVTTLGIPVVISPFIVITVSYVYIFFTILKMQSITGRQKAFSTCSSHLVVVFIYYGAIICLYIFPNQGQSSTVRKVPSVLYTVVTPMLNPMIYSLRNKDIKEALRKLIHLSL
ncbi:olfactory receptor 1468-like [Spea bombifrons]|uniref:olfactory receptor 1468-like n=1 Tax=Spea bombifrons TaxID=233779 RepID=UPI0023492666|nr:olfactory receptor 1468-like [Spea bombifrons]